MSIFPEDLRKQVYKENSVQESDALSSQFFVCEWIAKEKNLKKTMEINVTDWFPTSS